MFYEKHCSKLITDMTQVVVAVGLVSITANYVRTSSAEVTLLQNPDFWHRSILLGLTVLFSAYHLLVYIADSQTNASGDTSWAREFESPLVVIFLFLLDLLALAAMGAMFGVLAIGQPAPDQVVDVFAVSWRTLALLAGLAATWHLMIGLWHIAARSKIFASLSHVTFAVAHIVLSIVAGLSGAVDGTNVSMQLWTLAFGLVIAVLYLSRGRRVLKQAIAHSAES